MNDAGKYYCMIDMYEKKHAISGVMKYSHVNIWRRSVFLHTFWIILGRSRGNHNSGKSSSHLGQATREMKSSGDSLKMYVSTSQINRRHCNSREEKETMPFNPFSWCSLSPRFFLFYCVLLSPVCWLNSCVFCVFRCSC